MQQGACAQATEIDTGIMYGNHVQMQVADQARTFSGTGVKSLSLPPGILFFQTQAPDKFLSRQVEDQDTVITRRSQKQQVVFFANLMAMFEIRVPERTPDLKILAINEQLIAGGNVNFVIIKLDAAQAPVPAASGKINIRGIPVNVLECLLLVEIHAKDPAVAVPLLAAAHH